MFGFQTKQEFTRRRSFRTTKLTCRADAILAPAAEIALGQTINSRNLGQHAIFCALAANRSTCCIRITNAKQKSRAILILLRGRLLSCVYGRRDNQHYTFGREAFSNAQIDLFQNQTEFTAHPLSEESALAAAAFFEGRQLNQPENEQLQDFFATASKTIISRGAPGCFVLRDSDRNVHCVFYFCAGKIIGIYSYENGWLKNTRPETALQAVSKSKKLTGSAFMLAAISMQEIYDLTFSLTGVADTLPDTVEWLKPSSGNNEVLQIHLYKQRPSRLRDSFTSDSTNKHQAALAEISGYALRQVTNHSHHIDPSRGKAC